MWRAARLLLLLAAAGAAGVAAQHRPGHRPRQSVVGADGHVTGLEDRLARGLFTPQEAAAAERRLRRGLQEQGDATPASTGDAAIADAVEPLPPTDDKAPAGDPYIDATKPSPDISTEAPEPLPPISSEGPVEVLTEPVLRATPSPTETTDAAPEDTTEEKEDVPLEPVSADNSGTTAPPEATTAVTAEAVSTADASEPVAITGSGTPPEGAAAGPVCSEGCRVVSTTALAHGADGAEIAGLAVDGKAGVAYVAWADAEGATGLTRYVVGNGTGTPLAGAWPVADAPALEEPGDVAVGPQGEVYVLEGRARIRAFDGKTGKPRGEWGPVVDGTGLAVLPVGPDGSTWVYTIAGGKIQGFSTGDSGATVTLSGCWKEGQGADALVFDVEVCPEDPVDLAISFDASAGVPGTEAPPPTIWVVDQGMGMVHLYNLEGARVGAVNDGVGGNSHLFQAPVAISVDSFRGLAYVLDERAQEVVVVDRRGREWHRLGGGALGNGGNRCGFFARQRLLDATALQGTAPQDFPNGGAEVGIEVSLRRPGYLRAVRFYRAMGEAGPHTATVWGADGRALASVAFPPEATAASAGWVTVYLEEPFPLAADAAYTVSVNVNARATALRAVDPRGALDNGKDLRTAGAPGGRVSLVPGQFPTEAAGVHYVDVEVETEPYLSALASVGTLGTVFDPAVAQARGGGLTYYLNHVGDAAEESVVGLRCSGYPPHMGDCAAHLAGLDAGLLDDVKAALEGHPSVLGFSFWGGKYALHPELDYLQEGAALAKELGVGSIGLWMGGGLDPAQAYPFHSPDWPTGSPAASLTELAQLPYFKALLDDPAITTYVINAYAVSTAGIGLKLRFGTYSEADAASERAEFSSFTQYLATTYANTGKTFVLQAWSLDAFLADSTKTELVPEWATVATTWLNARQAGVEAGRAAAGQEPASVAVYHAVQLSRGVLDKSKGLTTPWAVDRILPGITVDLVGWAAFEASRQRDAAQLAAGVAALNAAVRRSAQGYQLDGLDFPRPDKARVRVFISEIGEPDARLKGEPEAAKQLLPGAVKAAVAANVPIVLYWAGYGTEAAEGPLPWMEAFQGAWLKRPDGTPSFAFCYLQAVAGKA